MHNPHGISTHPLGNIKLKTKTLETIRKNHKQPPNPPQTQQTTLKTSPPHRHSGVRSDEVCSALPVALHPRVLSVVCVHRGCALLLTPTTPQGQGAQRHQQPLQGAWEVLGSFGRFWEVLGGFGEFWGVVEGFWGVLGSFGG